MKPTLQRQLLSIAISGALCAAGAEVAQAAPFNRTASLQGVTFQVSARGDGSIQQLTVKTTDKGKPLPAIKVDTDGQVTGMEVEDLNSDGRPELLVYVTSAGSGSYGSVLAWTVSPAHTLLPIHMPELSGTWAKGYVDHDSFMIGETTLVRKFPIYRPGDSNAKPTGGIRNVYYKLVRGEASWQFMPVRSDQDPSR
jgi:hypothetical protein